MQITTVLPQAELPALVTTMQDLVQILPKKLDYARNVWIGDKMGRDGKAVGNIVFLIEGDEPTQGMQDYFDSLVVPLGIHATASNAWRGNPIMPPRLYNEGRLIIDKRTMAYTEFPSAIIERPEIVAEDILAKLPDTIPFKQTIWLTGSLAKNGWSRNDIDLFVGDEPWDEVIPSEELWEMRKYFTELFGCKTDVGCKVMKEREPIFCFRLYSDAQRWQH